MAPHMYVYRTPAGELVVICNGAIGRLVQDSEAVAAFLSSVADRGAEFVASLDVPPSLAALPGVQRWQPVHRPEKHPHP
jgi:hypothetical protein